MSRHFRPWTIDQTQLLPAAVVDYVPADHLAQFVVALAREHLDLSEIVASYKCGLGQPPFDPRMMTALLLYAYCSGFYSSRRIARACAERVDFMMIVAHDAPDFRTIADFRKRHLPALGRLFLQVLKLAEKAGLDFAKLVELFDAHQVSFVSVTQAFNTTTSMGRLTLNVLLSFAQFEREVTGERIRDKIAASKRKGIWMGGVVPLGYRVENRALHVVEEHAVFIRDLFRRYLEIGSVVRLKASSPRIGYGNVALFPTLGNHLDLRRLPGFKPRCFWRWLHRADHRPQLT